MFFVFFFPRIICCSCSGLYRLFQSLGIDRCTKNGNDHAGKDHVGDHVSTVIGERVQPYGLTFGCVRAPQQNTGQKAADKADESYCHRAKGVANSLVAEGFGKQVRDTEYGKSQNIVQQDAQNQCAKSSGGRCVKSGKHLDAAVSSAGQKSPAAAMTVGQEYDRNSRYGYRSAIGPGGEGQKVQNDRNGDHQSTFHQGAGFACFHVVQLLKKITKKRCMDKTIQRIHICSYAGIIQIRLWVSDIALSALSRVYAAPRYSIPATFDCDFIITPKKKLSIFF